MKKQTKIIIGVVALIAVIAVLLGIYAATRPDTTAGAKELTIVVVHGDESQKTFDIHTDAEYLDQALTENEIASGSDSEYGLPAPEHAQQETRRRPRAFATPAAASWKSVRMMRLRR